LSHGLLSRSVIPGRRDLFVGGALGLCDLGLGFDFCVGQKLLETLPH
jgi:hypothetical protein